jgi:eukaryotic-like serine/threonine-protein kinase
VRTVRRHDAPDWFRRLPADARPALPLPAGLTFAAAAGRYECAKDGSLLVFVPPGTYPTGSADPHMGQGLPPARHALPGFFMGLTEVTWGQWTRYCAATGRAAHDRRIGDANVPFADMDPGARALLSKEPFTPGDDHPVHSVTWQAARDYCAWAGLRLPREVEWEVAARGPRPGDYPWGDATDDQETRCNVIADRDGFTFSSPVGRFPAGASPFGCLDMAGNVWEWCEDEFTALGDDDDRGRRVIRGGAWNAVIVFSRATYRDGGRPDVGWALGGFRVCR